MGPNSIVVLLLGQIGPPLPKLVVRAQQLGTVAPFFIGALEVDGDSGVTGKRAQPERSCVMDRAKHVTLFRQKGLWYVSYYSNGKRIRV